MKKYKILIVDDDPDIVNAIQTILSMSGYSVITAENGQECLDIVIQERPNLILLDLMLPDMHGSVVAKQLRQNKEGVNIPIVVISASHEAKQIAATMDAQACIEKPFELHDLLSTVEINVRNQTHSESSN